MIGVGKMDIQNGRTQICFVCFVFYLRSITEKKKKNKQIETKCNINVIENVKCVCVVFCVGQSIDNLKIEIKRRQISVTIAVCVCVYDMLMTLHV